MSSTSPPSNRDATNRFLSILGFFALATVLLILNIPKPPEPEKTISWTEAVQLPDGISINVRRQYYYRGLTDPDGRPFWRGESLEIPATDGGTPITWKSDFEATGKVSLLALYFENNTPYLITQDLGYDEGPLGCAYTLHHKLFVWGKANGWVYDPFTRVDTSFVGWGNLISNPIFMERSSPPESDYKEKHRDEIQSDHRYYIDTLNEPTRCDTYPNIAKVSLQEVLSHKKNGL